jgi:hypothetical protein
MGANFTALPYVEGNKAEFCPNSKEALYAERYAKRKFTASGNR